MGDAREIKIPRDALIGMMTGLGILYRAGASENEWFPKLRQAVANLDAAGYRIIGPDEVDPVTLEKAAEAAENASIRVSYGILSQERDEPILHRTAIASLIRALGRKA